MKKSYLYLLVEAGPSAGQFKLGHSTDPFRRQKTLVQQFDLQRSLQLPFDRATVHKLEAHLHEKYAAYQIEPASIGICEGRNEWFSMDCFDDVTSYITSNWGAPEPIQPGMHRILVPIPIDLYKRMKHSCIRANIPVQQAVVDLIEQAYQDHPSLEVSH